MAKNVSNLKTFSLFLLFEYAFPNNFKLSKCIKKTTANCFFFFKRQVYIVKVQHVVHGISGAYPEMEKEQRNHVTIPGYQEENEVTQTISIDLEYAKKTGLAVRNINQSCRLA